MSTTEHDVPVDQRLCLALYRASHAMDATYRVLLADTGLTYPQYTVLSVLRHDGAAPVSAVARRLGLSTSTVSPLLQRMEARGWVTRERSGQDERTVVVDLTAEGRRLGDDVEDVPQRVVAAAGLGDAEQADLVGALQRLTAALREGLAPDV